MLKVAEPITKPQRSLRAFRRLRDGPEALLHYSLENCLYDLFPAKGMQVWAGSTVPVGAGVPDIVHAVVEPQLTALAGIENASLAIIGYLRAVGRVRSETIATKLRQDQRAVQRRLLSLIDQGIVEHKGATFAIADGYKCVLKEVHAIEVKVSDWKGAVSQASRNRIFSHRSYVAFPSNLAARVKHEPVFSFLGIGLISVDETDHAKILRRARKARPRAWTYYYGLANKVAEELKTTAHGISC